MFAFASVAESLQGIDQGWWVIGLGFLLLAIAVVVFARLRFIQTRPIRACIVLSVMAHLLIFGSAQFLRLFDTPQFPGENAIQFQLAFDDETVEPVEAAKPPAKRPPKPVEPIKPQPTLTPAPELKLVEAAPREPVLSEPTPPLPAPATFVFAEPGPERQAIERPTPEPPSDESAAPIEPPLPRIVELPPSHESGEPAAEPEPAPPLPRQIAELPDTHTAPAAAAPLDLLEPRLNERETMAPVPDAAPQRDNEQPTIKESVEGWRHVSRHESQPRSRYQLREAAHRAAAAKKRGGTKSTEEAVDAALRWLAKNQERDGRWSAAKHHAGRGGFVEGQLRQTTGMRADTGVTGLAMLAMLGGGHTHQTGSHRKSVQAGLEYLMSQQRSDGSLGGPAGSFAQMYCHGIATLALCEAYGMTKDTRLESLTRRAVEYTVRSQHRTTGGWRYYPGDPGDTSQFGWQLMVIESAKLAGIEVPAKSCELTKRFLSRVASGQHDGLAGYRPGQAATVSMTAEALACRAFLGRVDPNLQREGADFVIRHAPDRNHRNLYFWYYGTLALYQLDSEHWPTWNAALHNALVPTQQRRGRLAGSWDTDTVWGGVGGRVYTTAMAALCLEVYYRYVPAHEHQLARRKN
jgi:hypothetical protein